MSKITLNNVADLTSSSTAQSTINTNSSTVQTAFDNTLSLDGTSPNVMGAALDMNSFAIMNLPSPVSINSPARLADVQNLVAGGSITLSPLPAGGTQNQILAKNSSANYDASWISNPNLGTITVVGLVLNPTSTASYGIFSTQNLSGASFTGSGAANLIYIPSDVAQGGAGFVNGFEVSHVIGGSAMTGGRQSNATFLQLSAATNAANTNRNYVAVYGSAIATASDGGSNTGAGAKGGMFPLATWGDLQSGAVNMQGVGNEFDVSCRTGASVRYKTCLALVEHALDGVSGASIDTLLGFTAQSGALGMNTLISISDFGTQHPLKTTGTIMATTTFGAGATVANGIDFSSGVTITGSAFKSPSFSVDGSGNISGVAITGTGAVTGTSHKVGANQVVGARVTGYTAMTGSPDKATAYATGSVTLAQLAGRVAQLQADLTAHGLIGT